MNSRLSHRRRPARRHALLEGLESRRLFTFSVTAPFADVATTGAAPTTLSLNNHFDDPAITGTEVKMDFSPYQSNAAANPSATGSIVIEMYDTGAPITVANFLRYVDDGRYTNSIIHRNAWNRDGLGNRTSDFVLQGGAYYNTTTGGVLNSVPTYGNIQNEFSPTRSNLLGTLAMAKVDPTQPGGGPDTASSQWFINMANNASNLDNQNGGFTVFAHVLGSGMNIANTISNLPNDTEPAVPGRDPNGLSLALSGANSVQDLVAMTSASRVSKYTITSVTSSNPSLVSPAVSSSNLTLSYPSAHSGAATITVTATDALGTILTDAFDVTVGAQYTVLLNGAIQPNNTPVDFGSNSEGISASDEFTIINAGTSPLTFGPNGNTQIDVPTGFSLISPLSGTFPNLTPAFTSIPSGGTETFKIALVTATAGVKSGTVVVHTSDPNQPDFSIPVAGHVTFRQINVSTGGFAVTDGQLTTVDFGTAAVGSGTLSKTFRITNTGDEDLVLGAATLPTGYTIDPSTPLPPSVAANGGFFDVIIDVDSTSGGIKTGNVSIANNDLSHGPFDFPVTAHITSHTLAVSTTGSPLTSGTTQDFGTAQTGASQVITYTLANNGDSTLTLHTPTVGTGFSIVSGPADGTTLDPGATATVVVALDTASRGDKAATLSLPSDDPVSPFTLSLIGHVQGNGIAVSSAGSAIAYGSAATLNFGAAERGGSAQRTFTVTNNGVETLTLTPVVPPAGFTVVTQLPASLVPGASGDLILAVDTATTGIRSGTVTIASSDPDRPSFAIPVSAAVTLPVILGAGGSKSATFTDADGTIVTIAFTGPGSATLEFAGTSVTSTIVKKTAAVVTPAGAILQSINLASTNAATKLTVTTKGGNGLVDLGNISGAGLAVGSFTAKTARLTGAVNVGGAKALDLSSMVAGASVHVGALAGAPAISFVTVTGGSLTSDVAIKSLKVGPWTGASLTAPAISSLAASASFNGAVNVAGAIGTAAIKLVLAGSPWTVGAIGKLSVGAVSAGWAGTVSNAITSASVTGIFAGSLAVGSIGTFSAAAMTSASLHATVLLGKVAVKGAILNSAVRSDGNITSITAGAITSGSIIYAGVSSAITTGLPASTASLSGKVIGSISTPNFSGSYIAASVLGKVSATLIQTSSAAGIAADSIASLSGRLPSGAKVQLSNVNNPAALSAQITSAGSLGSLTITVF